MKKSYDAAQMLKRDRSMPELLTELAIANGCNRTANRYYNRCRLTYRNTLPDQENKLSRLNRLTMRRQPALLTRSP